MLLPSHLSGFNSVYDSFKEAMLQCVTDWSECVISMEDPICLSAYVERYRHQGGEGVCEGGSQRDVARKSPHASRDLARTTNFMASQSSMNLAAAVVGCPVIATVSQRY